MCPRQIIATCGLVAALAAPSFAVDGVIEINQAAVFAGGITPGDTPDFPVTLNQRGSYRLTGNLDVTKLQNGNPRPDAQNVTAIRVGANDVSIDLNGFSIIGPVSCVGTPNTCTPSGGTGIGVDGLTFQATTVLNGTVRGMGSDGISLDVGEGVVERVHADQNGGEGIVVEFGGVVRGCIANQNGTVGIRARLAVVANNSVIRNGAAGLVARNSTVMANVSSQNEGVGLDGDTNTGYGNNVFAGNNGGMAQVSGGPHQIPAGSNVCSGAICP